MSLKFNMNRPPLSDDEINKHKNFDQLVKQFKQQSLKKAQGDESWWKNKKIRYSTVIAGITVVCTISYLAVLQSSKQKQNKHETLTTQNTQSAKPVSKFIQAPSKKLSTAYSSYKVNANTGAVITHTSSSKITVPKNSFVDRTGKQLLGEVTIEYKEMHDLGDVIVSGVPMAYDSAGLRYQLESAGMFDIRAYQNGEPVFIKPGEEIEVKLASQNKEDRFNQYYLDTLAKNWQYLKRDDIKSNLQMHNSGQGPSSLTKQQSEEKLKQLKKEYSEVIPRKIDSVEKVYVKRSKLLVIPAEPTKPTMAQSGKPTFVIDASTDDFPELAAYENMEFEVGSENKNYSKEMHEVTWSDVKILQGPNKGKNYILQLSYRTRIEKLIVYPVLRGANFEKAKQVYEGKFDKYEQLLAERKQKEERLMVEMQAKQEKYLAEQKQKMEEYEKEKALQAIRYEVASQNQLSANFNSMGDKAKAERIFRVNRFGIYNSDCPHSLPAANAVSPIFVLNDKGQFLVPEIIYFIDHNSKTVTSVDRQSAFKFSYDDDKTYSICLFSQEKVFICTKENFNKARLSKTNKFKVSSISAAADNLPDFKKALEM